MSKKVGVLVVDDSPLCRELIAEALSQDGNIEVIGTAENGVQAIEQCAKLKPNVITMDFEMPIMDGLTATERIMAEMPTPILVLTGDPRSQAPELTHRALAVGALALQVKPALDAGPEAWNLAREVRLLSSVKVIRHLKAGPAGKKNPSHAALPQVVPPKTKTLQPATVPLPSLLSSSPIAQLAASSVGIVAIASSTGGPQVVHKLLSELPADFPTPIVLVQHINAAFVESLAGWLGSSSKLKVRIARNTDALVPGLCLVAPPQQHLMISARGKVAVISGEPRDGHIPSGTVLLESAANVYGRRALGIVLTGMGTDGADGLLAIKTAGGRTIAQNQESCVVFGMPGAAIAKNAAEMTLHGDDMAQAMVRICMGDSTPRSI